MERVRVTITIEQDGQRLDSALFALGVGLSRRKIRMVIDQGGVYLNRSRMRIASRPVRVGDQVEMVYQTEALTTKQATDEITLLATDVLHNERGLIAINKPPGLPSQATRDQAVVHAERSLNTLLASQGLAEKQLILLHRLDKETSGILLFGTNTDVATFVTGEFRERRIEKQYLAVVYGVPENKKFEMSCYLSDIDKRTGSVRKVSAGGKSSHTSFELLASSSRGEVSLILCRPTTGRSHQIRVHLELSGHPIVGDKKYGQRSLASLPEAWRPFARYHLLHAMRLRIPPQAPGGQSVSLAAPVPKQFESFLKVAQIDRLSALI